MVHANHDARRTEVIYAVWQVIAHGGIESVSMRSVAAAAGVSVGRIQHYFGTREALIRASAQAMIDAAEAMFEADTHPDDAAGQVRLVLLGSIPQDEQGRTGVSVWFGYIAAAVRDPAIGKILGDATQESAELLSGVLDRLGVPEPSAAALELAALADGLTQRALLGRLPADAAVAAMEAAIDRVLATGTTKARSTSD